MFTKLEPVTIGKALVDVFTVSYPSMDNAYGSYQRDREQAGVGDSDGWSSMRADGFRSLRGALAWLRRELGSRPDWAEIGQIAVVAGTAPTMKWACVYFRRVSRS